MAVSVVSTTTTTHKALVSWADFNAALDERSEKMLLTRPVITITGGGMNMPGMPITGALAGMQLSWGMTPQKLDEILRASIEGLPTLGYYSVTSLTGDPVNALSVDWKEET